MRRPRTQRKESQLSLDLRKHGGKRKGAGRPSVDGGRRHEKRPRVTGREPLHVTIKLREGLPSLRHKVMHKAFHRAVERAKRQGLRLVHFALLSNHAHLLLEAQDKPTLTRGLQSFSITLSKALNKLGALSGCTLKDRYHLHILKTPTEARRALQYILANEAKHRGTRVVRADAFSSVALLKQVMPAFLKCDRFEKPSLPLQQALLAWLQALCSRPQTWLLRGCVDRL